MKRYCDLARIETIAGSLVERSYFPKLFSSASMKSSSVQTDSSLFENQRQSLTRIFAPMRGTSSSIHYYLSRRTAIFWSTDQQIFWIGQRSAEAMTSEKISSATSANHRSVTGICFHHASKSFDGINLSRALNAETLLNLRLKCKILWLVVIFIIGFFLDCKGV